MNTLASLTWQQQKVNHGQGNLLELRQRLPEFRLETFGEGDNANEDLWQVVRQPLPDDPRSIPVGVVSKNYHLVQHTELLGWIAQALVSADVDDPAPKVAWFISRYAERIWLELEINGSDFDPGDGYFLRLILICQNSVERSCALEVSLLWQRLVCLNGLIVNEGGRLRRLHVPQSKHRWDIEGWLKGALGASKRDRESLAQWWQTPVEMRAVERWADQTLTQRWDANLAARACGIARSGWDGRIQREQSLPPSRWPVSYDEPVPGIQTPVQNLYHVAQVLAWIASRIPHLEERWEKTKRIRSLVGTLAQMG